MIQLTNSLTGQLEPFVPLEDKKVKMYVCGPTVYDFARFFQTPVKRLRLFDDRRKMLLALL